MKNHGNCAIIYIIKLQFKNNDKKTGRRRGLKLIQALKLLIIPSAIILSLIGSNLYALTTDEIILLKKNGVSDETIQLMLKNDLEKSKYDSTSPGIKETDNAITYSTGKSSDNLSREEQENLDRAWDMLRHLKLEIDR